MLFVPFLAAAAMTLNSFVISIKILPDYMNNDDIVVIVIVDDDDDDDDVVVVDDDDDDTSSISC